MTPNIFKQATFAQASYASFDTPTNILAALQRPDGGFTLTQANRFANKYSLVTQFNDDAGGGGNGTSFSVAVFKESGTNKLTVAMRGTADSADYVPTDQEIFLNGAGYDQIVAMQNWWRREASTANQMVDQYEAKLFASGETIPAGALLLTTPVVEGGTSWYLLKKATVAATGNLVDAIIASGGSVDVTGHSLGGHLAMAFQALNDTKTATVTTFNAPGFLNSGRNQQFFTTLGGSVPTGAKTTNVIADGVRAADVSFKAIAGLHGRPGTAVDVRIENQVPSGEPQKPDAFNHSMTILTDALAVADNFARIDPSFNLKKFQSLFDANTRGQSQIVFSR
jgi:hypothetical protein